MTWGEFLAGVKPFGVSLRTTIQPAVTTGKQAQYLIRTMDGEEPRWYAMPLVWHEGSRVGSFRVDAILRRLDIRVMEAFPGWYYLM